jgi:hypothetical protein
LLDLLSQAGIKAEMGEGDPQILMLAAAAAKEEKTKVCRKKV